MADGTSSPLNVTSFDSANSENVFLAASMTSKDFRESILTMDASNKDSDDSQSTTNSASAISYKQLHDGDADIDRLDHPNGHERAANDNDEDDDSSNQSSLDIPTSDDGNLRTLPGFLSESSQNLLGNDDDDSDDLLVDDSNEKGGFDVGDDSRSNTDSTLDIISHKTFADSDVISMDTPPLLRPPVRPDNDRVETESIQSLSEGGGVFTHSEENLLIISSGLLSNNKGVGSKPDNPLSRSSPHISVSSETDILRFDIEQGAKACVADAQSIDSHMFTMLDKDKSLTTLNSDDVAEQTLVMGGGGGDSVGGDGSEGISLASDDGSSQQRVRFQGNRVFSLYRVCVFLFVM